MSSTFLIVDDDPDLRHLVDVALGRWGQQAIVAETVRDARRICAEAEPDVLLLDVSMPEMDGPAFLTSLRAEGLAPPHIYLLSALEPDELAAIADSLGVRYLVKPFTLQGLRDGLADVLDAPREPGDDRHRHC